MPTSYKNVNNLKVAEDLLLFVNNELLKDTGIDQEKFWLGFSDATHELAKINKELVKKRESIQKKIDDWHIKNKKKEIKIEDYKKFLKEIDYLLDEGKDFNIETENVDDEITKIAGPQFWMYKGKTLYELNK